MIATSVDTQDFSQIVPIETFSAESPHTNPMLAASLLDVTQSEKGLAVSVTERGELSQSVSVENTLQEVIARCQREAELHPRSARSQLNLALALMNGGHEDAGAHILKGILKIQPTHYATLTSLALFFFKRGALKEAEAAYRRLHSAYPSDPSPLINLATIELRRDDFIRAAEFLQRAVALDGCSAMARYLLAMVLIRLGRHNQSIALLRGTLRAGEQSAELNQGLAIAYLAAGDIKRAERCFLTALAVNRNMAAAVHGLAILRLQHHRLDEAVDALLDHISRFPNDSQARELLARAYVEMGQFSRARGQLSMLIPADADSAETRTELARISNNIGFCFAHEGKTADAETWLKRSLTLDGKRSAAPYTNLARMFLPQGRLKEALNILTQLDGTSYGNADSAMLKSVTLIGLQEHDQAIQVLQSLINTGTAPAAAYADLGWLLADWREEYDASLAVLRDGYAKEPRNVFLLNNLAYVHLMRGEPEFARAVLDQAPADSGNQIILTATKGLLLLWEGNIPGGEELYRKAETLAFQSGQRPLAISIRQKRHLEMSRAYMRKGQEENAIQQVRLGLAAKGGQRPYRYFEQLLEIGHRLALPEPVP